MDEYKVGECIYTCTDGWMQKENKIIKGDQ